MALLSSQIHYFAWSELAGAISPCSHLVLVYLEAAIKIALDDAPCKRKKEKKSYYPRHWRGSVKLMHRMKERRRKRKGEMTILCLWRFRMLLIDKQAASSSETISFSFEDVEAKKQILGRKWQFRRLRYPVSVTCTDLYYYLKSNVYY